MYSTKMDTIDKGSDFAEKSARPKVNRLTESVLGSTDVEDDIVTSHTEDVAASEMCVLDDSLEDNCGPCKVTADKKVKAEWFCKGCKDYLCTHCKSYHKALKVSSNHTLINYQEVNTSKQVPCGPCKETEDGKIVTSVWYCKECDEFLCDSCRAYHKGLKLTRGHSLITKEERFEDLRKIIKSQEIAKPKTPKDTKSSTRTNKSESVAMSLSSVPKPYIKVSSSQIREHNMALSEDDMKPDIMRSSFISNSRVILADQKNKSLKFFETQSTEISIVTKKN